MSKLKLPETPPCGGGLANALAVSLQVPIHAAAYVPLPQPSSHVWHIAARHVGALLRLTALVGPLQTLYLSKNCLRSLQGIQQFSSVVTLALADNLIDSFDQLEFLLMANEGRSLRALSLEGNPLARLPNYRSA